MKNYIDDFINNEELNDQEKIRIKKILIYEQMGILPFGSKYDQKDHAVDVFEKAKNIPRDQLEKKQIFVSVAGRIVLLRSMGKIAFFVLKDRTGKIQCYISINNVSKKDFDLFKLADLGDIVGAVGFLFYTNSGELTVKVTQYFHLSKALSPLPNKFFGLKNIEEIQRKRYLDLIMNDKNFNNLIKRFHIIKAIRKFCDDLGFIEVETSILSSIAGGADARPFVTHHNSLNRDFYLRIATEIPLKKLIIGGLERVYEIGKIFRNEGIDNTHNPEFTTIELYQAYGDLDTMRLFVENLFKYIANTLFNKTEIIFNDIKIDFNKPFRYISMLELIKLEKGIDFSNITFDEAISLAKKNNLETNGITSIGEIIMLFFETFCEKKIIQPTFVHTYPLESSPLARRKIGDNRFIERFELFIDGKEIANAYFELNDPIDQKIRFQQQLNKKATDSNEKIDEDFLTAMKYGFPPTCGLGIGIDRLVMIFCNENSIKNVIAFPTLRNFKNE